MHRQVLRIAFDTLFVASFFALYLSHLTKTYSLKTLQRITVVGYHCVHHIFGKGSDTTSGDEAVPHGGDHGENEVISSVVVCFFASRSISFSIFCFRLGFYFTSRQNDLTASCFVMCRPELEEANENFKRLKAENAVDDVRIFRRRDGGGDRKDTIDRKR